MDRRSYSFPLEESFLIHTSKARDLNSGQTDNEDRQGRQNPRFHGVGKSNMNPMMMFIF